MGLWLSICFVVLSTLSSQVSGFYRVPISSLLSSSTFPQSLTSRFIYLLFASFLEKEVSAVHLH
jgi:hypothetical protein